MKKTKKFLSIFAILFVAIFALSCCFFAACGSKDDDDDDTKIEDTTTGDDESTGGDESGDDESTGGDDGSENQGGTSTPATVSSVTLTADKTTLEVDDTTTLTASVTMSDGSDYTGDYTWTSSNESVATVGNATTTSGSNTATAVGVGTSKITVTAGGVTSDASTIAVTEATPEPTKVSDAGEMADALKAGGDIVLGANITGEFAVDENTTVTLDLAGFSITGTEVSGTTETADGGTQYTITVKTGASLTIKDTAEAKTGSVICTYNATGNENSRLGAAIYTCGALNIEGGTIKSSSVGILAEGGTTTMKGGTINSTYYAIFEAHGVVTVNICGDAKIDSMRGIYVGGDAYYGYGSANDSNSWVDSAKCILNVYGNAKISTSFGSPISTLGYTGMNTATINISENCTISGRPIECKDEGSGTESTIVMPAIYLPNGILNISGGTIEGSTAVEVRGGTATITGGTLKTTSSQPNDPQWNGSGATSYGYALAVYSYETVKRPDTQNAIDNELTVTVSGDAFIDGPLCDTYKDGADVPKYTFSITGGTFTTDPSNYLETPYVAVAYGKDGEPVGEGNTGDAEYYQVIFDDSIYALYLDFTGNEYSEILSETRAHSESGVTVDSGGIFTVMSGLKDNGSEEKIAIKNGGLNFGGGASATMNVTLNLSSFNGKNITIGYTA